MVKPWDIDYDKVIAITKMRIKHHEKHGNGMVAMRDKSNLKKLERQKELRTK